MVQCRNVWLVYSNAWHKEIYKYTSSNRCFIINGIDYTFCDEHTGGKKVPNNILDYIKSVNWFNPQILWPTSNLRILLVQVRTAGEATLNVPLFTAQRQEQRSICSDNGFIKHVWESESLLPVWYFGIEVSPWFTKDSLWQWNQVQVPTEVLGFEMFVSVLH